ncbi:uncharacterized protein LOC117105526 [Anneissia japonica]|uniref:uncharacterized protein LOC117105526 n=1 Tax=Anneissia japonica TaxID=1529436 RepID=UPI0014258A53|nr:uncharacterized protein LOC117105526 [Anneissia japonica]
MAVNGPNKYDFYITSDDREWETRILKRLQEKGFSSYHRGKFTLGGLKTTSRLHGVQNCRVKIIGFAPPSKMTTANDTYVASLALEHRKQNDQVICVKISKNSVIPSDYSALVAYDGWDEDDLCERISHAINIVKDGGSVGGSDTTEYTSDTVDSSTSHQVRHEQDFGPITDLRIAMLAKKLGDDWTTIGVCLGLSFEEVHDLRDDYRVSRERNERMLVMWRKRHSGSPAEKLKFLMEALKNCDRIDLKEEVSQWR